MKHLMFIFFSVGYLYMPGFSCAQTYVLNSPDERLQCLINAGDKIDFSLIYQGNEILRQTGFSLKFEESPVFGRDVSVIDALREEKNEDWIPVAGQFEKVSNHFNQLVLRIMEKKYPKREIQLTFRAYDDGFAFRYTIPESWKRLIPLTAGDSRDWIMLLEEHTAFTFTDDPTVWAADYGSYASHQESEFIKQPVSEIPAKAIVGLPLLARVDPEIYLAITEADLTDWAGMYLRKKEFAGTGNEFTLVSDLSPLPDGNGRVRVVPGMDSPWRVVMTGNSPGALVESSIITNLNDPCALADPSWIKPGVSAWDHWWSGEVKMDTRTVKDYIQLASDMGWEYMLVDWHWYGAPFITEGEWRPNPEADITTVNPAIDMPAILNFAEKENVKLILWLLWNHVDKQIDVAFPLYEKWGIAGVKIDFMARDDQEMVRWYHKVVKKAAEHHLVVDFHGAYKPTGWSRTYPNLLTREGVLGNEYSKWSFRITPEHNVTLPFTRMLAGPMDYTPGAFINVTPQDFRTGTPARVMNTRAHQLAMFVVYFSPYTVACDHPDNYRNQPGIEFLKEVPTTWDDTKVLAGEVGEYIVMARRKDNRWYIGAMGNSQERKVKVSLEFLPEGEHTLVYFRDAVDSDVHPQHLDTGKSMVNGKEYLEIELAPAGGFAGWIEMPDE